MNLSRFLLRLSSGFLIISILAFPFLPELNNTKLFGDQYFVDPYFFYGTNGVIVRNNLFCGYGFKQGSLQTCDFWKYDFCNFGYYNHIPECFYPDILIFLQNHMNNIFPVIGVADMDFSCL